MKDYTGYDILKAGMLRHPTALRRSKIGLKGCRMSSQCNEMARHDGVC